MELRDSNSQPQQDSSGPSSSVTALIQNITSNMSVFGYPDEYDPLRPNDYEKIKNSPDLTAIGHITDKGSG